jgi:carboxylesterase
MAQHAHLDPGPFLLDGGATGVLFIHGFTGAPPELRLQAEYLNERGLTAMAPLLPGHGTRVEDMNRVHWEGWTDHVEAALSWLEQRCDRVFVAGLSMGGLLALHLAALNPRVEGLLLYAPALRATNRFLPYTSIIKRFKATKPKPPRNMVDPAAESRIWSYDRDPIGAAEQLYRGQKLVRPMLPSIVCPALLFRTTRDTTVPAAAVEEVLASLGTDDKQLITLTGSAHCMTVDAEWEQVAEQSWAFIQRVACLEG